MTTTVSILIAFGVYLLGMIGIGIWSMRQTKGADDFFLGGRGLSAPVAAMSAQASDMSGWLLMGLPGSVYALGTGQAWIAVGLGLGTIANWLNYRKTTSCIYNCSGKFYDASGIFRKPLSR